MVVMNLQNTIVYVLNAFFDFFLSEKIEIHYSDCADSQKDTFNEIETYISFLQKSLEASIVHIHGTIKIWKESFIDSSKTYMRFYNIPSSSFEMLPGHHGTFEIEDNLLIKTQEAIDVWMKILSENDKKGIGAANTMTSENDDNYENENSLYSDNKDKNDENEKSLKHQENYESDAHVKEQPINLSSDDDKQCVHLDTSSEILSSVIKPLNNFSVNSRGKSKSTNSIFQNELHPDHNQMRSMSAINHSKSFECFPINSPHKIPAVNTTSQTFQGPIEKVEGHEKSFYSANKPIEGVSCDNSILIGSIFSDMGSKSTEVNSSDFDRINISVALNMEQQEFLEDLKINKNSKESLQIVEMNQFERKRSLSVSVSDPTLGTKFSKIDSTDSILISSESDSLDSMDEFIDANFYAIEDNFHDRIIIKENKLKGGTLLGLVQVLVENLFDSKTVVLCTYEQITTSSTLFELLIYRYENF
ncbi:hypothetical protein O9G_000825 [Rozella allomycis CSF55]|uniref:N-terminal Ras-GEF domain-containing protein n=1 Tax=Rozella allomycis (strain CSF55) TaxID=988480 RepID=A0A075ARE9_ROZAC|nr:hypothetical protein O9G_000825 [Rozella allomycis CSF55]|eukprot:EPZ32750.1 hypothetical protein O9G_000825 [Rozella allomycis CSF55]